MQAAIADTSPAHLLAGSAAMHCGAAVRVIRSRSILPHPPLQAGVFVGKLALVDMPL